MERVPSPKNIYENWHEISNETISDWLSPDNLENKTKRTFEGFEITDSIDGQPDSDLEVSLVKITKQGQYPQHVHRNSDAYFIVTNGKALLLSKQERKQVLAGERIEIPRGTPHGFELEDGDSLEFISLQSPPIRNKDSEEEDFYLFEQI